MLIPRFSYNAILKIVLEQVTEAIVLDKEWSGEAHARVHLFTKDWGRVVAKATSIRKITSKLGAHLEPLNIVTVRLIQKNHLPQAVDALRVDKLSFKAFPGLRLVKELALEYERDYALWKIARYPVDSPSRYVNNILAVLGYDPQFAACAWCERAPTDFSFSALAFVCGACLPGAGDCVRL